MPMEFSKDTQTVIQRGQAAWQRLLSKEQETWSDWLAIGEAIEEASTAMMRALGLNRPEGKRWADNFGDWLTETGFHKIDKAVRSRLKKCMEHRGSRSRSGGPVCRSRSGCTITTLPRYGAIGMLRLAYPLPSRKVQRKSSN